MVVCVDVTLLLRLEIILLLPCLSQQSLLDIFIGKGILLSLSVSNKVNQKVNRLPQSLYNQHGDSARFIRFVARSLSDCLDVIFFLKIIHTVQYGCR